MQKPALFSDHGSEDGEKVAAVAIVAKDHGFFVSAAHHVVHGFGKLHSERPRHLAN
jgi:hypothetical protein